MMKLISKTGLTLHTWDGTTRVETAISVSKLCPQNLENDWKDRKIISSESLNGTEGKVPPPHWWMICQGTLLICV